VKDKSKTKRDRTHVWRIARSFYYWPTAALHSAANGDYL